MQNDMHTGIWALIHTNPHYKEIAYFGAQLSSIVRWNQLTTNLSDEGVAPASAANDERRSAFTIWVTVTLLNLLPCSIDVTSFSVACEECVAHIWYFIIWHFHYLLSFPAQVPTTWNCLREMPCEQLPCGRTSSLMIWNPWIQNIDSMKQECSWLGVTRTSGVTIEWAEFWECFSPSKSSRKDKGT